MQKSTAHLRVSHGADSPDDIPTLRFDFDHVSAKISEQLGGKGAHQHGSQINDANAIQRAAHGNTPKWRTTLKSFQSDSPLLGLSIILAKRTFSMERF